MSITEKLLGYGEHSKIYISTFQLFDAIWNHGFIFVSYYLIDNYRNDRRTV